jgi:hypothetical protein
MTSYAQSKEQVCWPVRGTDLTGQVQPVRKLGDTSQTGATDR